jgi:hypothetical protein
MAIGFRAIGFRFQGLGFRGFIEDLDSRAMGFRF